MRSSLVRRAIGTVLVALLTLLAGLESGQAAVVIFKDGYTIKGTLRREGETIFDPNGQQVPVAKGFYYMEDGARRFVFSVRTVQQVLEQNVDANPDLVVLQRPFVRLNNLALESVGEILEVGNFDDNWDRNFKFNGKPGGVLLTQQKMTALTPHFAKVDAAKHRWSSYYLTRELGPETVRALIHGHPDCREKEGKADPAKRQRVFRFFKQVGWYDVAELELNEWLREAPLQKAKIEELRLGLKTLQAEMLVGDIERAAKVGRHDWARERLASFPKADADEKMLAQVRVLQRKYEAAEATMKAVEGFLKDLPARVKEAGERKVWEHAAAAILAELHVDNAARLEKFVEYAQLAERQRKDGKTPSEAPSALMARAVNNWLLGNTSPAKPDEGLKLWRTRQFVLEHQKTTELSARKRMLASYEKDGPLPADEMAQLISLLPPVDPEEKLGTGVLEMETKEQVGRRKGGVPYLLQLPPEYNHNRSRPVLIVLNQAGDKPKDILERWSELAAQHGYLLAAPDWGEDGARKQYTYSTEEHAAVLETLRDLKRRFNVDTDRVFLAGFGQGGEMAFDVGQSHPDQFAGVVTMACQPRLFASRYAPNAQYLPFYVIGGDMQAHDNAKSIRRHFETWVSRAAPALYVEYKGRALEWFDGELTYVFDWMGRKKRWTGVPAVNEPIAEFQSMRPGDNQFYWLTTEGIGERFVADARNFNYLAAAATLSGRIQEGNQIHVKANGFKQVTLWLGRGMVDFEKKAAVTVNLQQRIAARDLTPNLGTLLEDFYQRNDRQRLFLVKIDIPL